MWLILSSALAGTVFPCGVEAFLTESAAHGSLNHVERSCLDEATHTAGPHQAQASALVLTDATASGNRVRWARAAAHHLDAIDPDDVGLTLAYARYLFANTTHAKIEAFTAEALRQADGWTDPGPAIALHRLRTTASLSAWSHGLTGQETVHTQAIQWLAALRTAGRTDATALDLCRTTGPSADCEETPTVAAADTGLRAR